MGNEELGMIIIHLNKLCYSNTLNFTTSYLQKLLLANIDTVRSSQFYFTSRLLHLESTSLRDYFTSRLLHFETVLLHFPGCSFCNAKHKMQAAKFDEAAMVKHSSPFPACTAPTDQTRATGPTATRVDYLLNAVAPGCTMCWRFLAVFLPL